MYMGLTVQAFQAAGAGLHIHTHTGDTPTVPKFSRPPKGVWCLCGGMPGAEAGGPGGDRQGEGRRNWADVGGMGGQRAAGLASESARTWLT